MTSATRLATRFDANNCASWQANDTATPDYDLLRRRVPSLFSEGAHHSRSDRYGFVPTIEVMRGLWREGWAPTFAAEGKARDASKRGFTKHMVRFRQRDVKQLIDGVVAELVMINSHDGSTKYQLFGGAFRFICLNGMVSGETFSEIRVPHRQRIVEDVIDASYTVAEDFPKIGEQVEAMRAIPLQREERLLLANAAHRLRFGEGDEQSQTGEIVQAGALLQPRRHADTGTDLWTTFNVIQENVVRGGLDGQKWDGEKRRYVRRTSRPVAGIADNVRLNRELWTLAEEMAKLKSAA
jgi:Domain of unknown function (DUF932)